MKKLLGAVAIASMGLLVSCSGNGPEGAAESFVMHTTKGEFAEAKKYSTETTAQLLSMGEAMGGERLSQMREQNKDAKVEIISSEVTKDSLATVKYKVTGVEGPAEEKSVDLVKRDGEWKVNINKEGGAGAGAPVE